LPTFESTSRVVVMILVSSWLRAVASGAQRTGELEFDDLPFAERT
jgi:hypothetical protein